MNTLQKANPSRIKKALGTLALATLTALGLASCEGFDAIGAMTNIETQALNQYTGNTRNRTLGPDASPPITQNYSGYYTRPLTGYVSSGSGSSGPLGYRNR